MSTIATINRTALRQRPGGWPIMHQTWDKLLFLHWPVEIQELRRLIPAGLEIDTYQGTAWIGVTPLTITGLRPPLAPPVPILSTTHELNVRTYVYRDGVPGVWFLSLDASNSLAVWGARVGFALPYFQAAMELRAEGARVEFDCVRTHRGALPAEFQATWQVGSRLPEAAPESRDFFLIERYCLYSSDGEYLYRAMIHHQPWPLHDARLECLSSNVIESHGLMVAQETPLVHALAEPLKVQVWPPERVGRADEISVMETA